MTASFVGDITGVFLAELFGLAQVPIRQGRASIRLLVRMAPLS